MQAGSRREKRGGPRVAPTRVPRDAPAARRPSDKPLLRLALARGNLALELDGPLALGPLTVTDLSVILPDVRFPVDLTGGVTRFRHRRGALSRAAVTIKTEELARFAAPKLRGLIGDGTPHVLMAPVEGGVLVGVSATGAALAFDVLLAPMGGDLRLVLDAPRGIGLGAPAFVVALQALGALTKPLGARRGATVVLADAAGALARRVLPEAGARAPSVRGLEMALGRPSALGLLTILGAEGAAPPALERRTLRALELAELVERWDDLALGGDLDAARAGYLAALERAPRHPEISMRLAAIDLAAGDRAEAALGTVVEAMPAIEAGVVGGELLAASGDREGAHAAFLRAAEDEPYGPLAALSLLAAARVTDDRDARLAALDGALVRAPGHLEARWERLAARLATGDLRGAMGDAEHVEAASSGSVAKHAAVLRAATLFAERGYASEAASRFERALRYAPSSAEGVLGLARALRDLGKSARALDLFARASALSERTGRPSPACELELAKSLAEHARDLPAAVARALRVPQQARETFEARLLEGRWRAELGDLTGSARALARLREAAEVLPGPPEERGRVARWLAEAARIDEHELGDAEAAHRDLALALRIAPRDASIASELRRLSRVAPPRGAATRDPMEEGAPTAAPRGQEPTNAAPQGAEEIDESVVEALTARLRADPSNHAVALELARALTLLGRDLELLALLSARIEEGSPEARAELLPMRRQVLARLATSARSDGRSSEAELYELMRDAEE